MPVPEKDYDLLDPQVFFQPFSAIPYRDPMAILASLPEAARSFYGEFGYMRGTEGAQIGAGHTWAQGVRSDPNDYDLSVTVIHLPTASSAASGFQCDVRPSSEGRNFAARIGIANAHDAAFSEKGPIRVLDARYGNYLFKVVAVISEHGFFSNDSSLRDHLRKFDTHVSSILSRSSQVAHPN